MPIRQANTKQEPLKMVGHSTFGQHPKISLEQIWNMYVSDNALVPFPGYQSINNLNAFQGRGIYRSTKFKHLIQVSDNHVYIIDDHQNETIIGNIDTFVGDVFIAENNVGQIGICDKVDIWMFNYNDNTFQKASLDFIPGHLSSQNGRFAATVLGGNTWRLTPVGNGLSFPNDAQHVGAFATNDSPLATVPIPGLENNLLVMGSIVTQLWVDVGAQLFPYQKSSGYNIDYGTVNAACIGALDRHVVWVAANGQSGPVIVVSNGADVESISTDGIDFKFGELTEVNNCYGFLFKQDGHLFYQVTFPGKDDNFSLVYDFNQKGFSNLSDENMNYHIAKRIAFFENSYYFVSFKDGNTYNVDSNHTTYNGATIPRIRICPHFRMPDSSPFIIQNITFTIEQGYSHDAQRVDLSLSTDGGASFGNVVSRTLNTMGNRPNILNWNTPSGRCNDLIPQFRFYGMDRFLPFDGVMEWYQ